MQVNALPYVRHECLAMTTYLVLHSIRDHMERKVQITQKIRKEKKTFRKMERPPDERHTQTHGSLVETF